jgi:hypothetical protein
MTCSRGLLTSDTARQEAGAPRVVHDHEDHGEPDGDGHPNVGALVAEWLRPGEKQILCSGTLIDEDLFLTAGHCTGFLESQGIEDVWVISGSTRPTSSPPSP